MLNLDKDKLYILACSFGPDSMALFSMLLEEGYRFVVANVNYNLREESKKESNDLSIFCKEHDITLYHLEVTKEIGHSNVEAKCRKIRYDFFKDIYDIVHADSLLVGHNQDDLIETYILQKNRKNLVKYWGICDDIDLFGMKVRRPLLSEKKINLQKYCENHHIPFAIDSSNLLDTYERNKIRHQIVSKMSDGDRNKIMEEIFNRNAQLTSMFNKLLSLNLHDANCLLSLSNLEQQYALKMLSEEIASDINISKKCTSNIKNALLSGKPNIFVPVNSHYNFVKEYNFCFFDLINENHDYLFNILEPCVLDTDYFYLDFTKDTKNRNVYLDDYPLVIRPYKKGDQYKIKDYLCDVRRLYIDWKMPMSLRKRWPIILNKDEKIIYIPRYQKNFKVTADLNFYTK